MEKEPYCREVLLRRQRDGLLPLFPIWDDIRTFDGTAWADLVDVVTAGFPCQPFSAAGKKLGKDDERNLWPDTIRVIREVGPRVAFLENVPGLVSHDYFGEILGDLAEAGLDARWEIVSAAETGAPHRRERLWIVADSRGQQHESDCHEERRTSAAELYVADAESKRWSEQDEPRENVVGDGLQSTQLCPSVPDAESDGRGQGDQDDRGSTERAGEGEEPGFTDSGGVMADPDLQGRQNSEGSRTTASKERDETPRLCGWWEAEPDVGRVADGVALRVDRLTATSNGQVPAVAARAWRLLNG